MNETPQSNQDVIRWVVRTVCICAFIGVVTEAVCVYMRVPDMNTQIAGGFTHVVDTLIGALLAMLVSTRSQHASPPPASVELPIVPIAPVKPAEVTIVNKPSEPVPVTEKP